MVSILYYQTSYLMYDSSAKYYFKKMFINLQNKFTDRLVGYKEHFRQLPLCHPLLIAKLRNRIPNRFISISPVKLKMLRFAIYHYSTPKNTIPIPNTSQYYHLIVLFHPPVPVLFALGNY